MSDSPEANGRKQSILSVCVFRAQNRPGSVSVHSVCVFNLPVHLSIMQRRSASSLCRHRDDRKLSIDAPDCYGGVQAGSPRATSAALFPFQ